MGPQDGSGAVAPEGLSALSGLAASTVPWAVRLPDGHTIPIGEGPPRFTVVVRVAPAVAALSERRSMLAVGEAFIDGAFDIEGDFLAAMETAYRLAAGPSQESFAAPDSA